jgi:hypothetical protein
MLYVHIPMLKLIFFFYLPTYLTNYLCTTLCEPHKPPLPNKANNEKQCMRGDY